MTRKAHENGALSLAFASDGKILAIGSWRTNSIGLWDTEEYKLKTTIKAPGNEVTCLAFTHDGRTLAASTGENMIGLFFGQLKCAAPS